MMQLISVNIGQVRAIQYGKESGMTGIYKLPMQTPVEITAEGLAGDAICDTESHGGVDQAVYIYGAPDYAWWSAVLGSEVAPGMFGENLTISDLESATLWIGDRLRIGSVLLQVTAPRIPCVTLATRMGDPTFVKRFRHAERPGLYCRVLQKGFVTAGDSVVYEPNEDKTISVLEMFRDAYTHQLTEAALRQYLAAPIAIRDRVEKEKQLRELLG